MNKYSYGDIVKLPMNIASLQSRRNQNIIAGALFLFLVPLGAQLMFSRLGFNATDDGFILAYSRRLLEGQFPHRDFISIRPVGSPLLHTPFVLLGGDYTFWISRLFVWFEFAFIAWTWMAIVGRLMKVHLGVVEKYLLALIAFTFSVHNFPIMAWHTVDALFLLTAGVYICLGEPRGWKFINSRFIGYVIIGLAYTCKQNFALASLLTVIILGDWRRRSYWLAVAAPGVLYFLLAFAAGALPDTIQQLGSQSDLVEVGLNSYLNRYVIAGLAAGFAVAALLFLKKEAGRESMLVRLEKHLMLLLLFTAAFIGASLLAEGYTDLGFGVFSFAIFGVVTGTTLYLGVAVFFEKRGELSGFLRTAVLTTLLAWSVSISVGYNNPSLVSGQLFVLLFLCCYSSIEDWKKVGVRASYLLLMLALVASCLFGFTRGRLRYIYRDLHASELNCSLGGLFPGAQLLETNQNNCDVLADVNQAIGMTGGTYAIIADFAGYWVKAPQANPLSIDWPINVELSNPDVAARAKGDLERLRGNVTILVQKSTIEDIGPHEFIPVEENYSPLIQYTRSNFTLVGETRYFALYR